MDFYYYWTRRPFSLSTNPSILVDWVAEWKGLERKVRPGGQFELDLELSRKVAAISQIFAGFLEIEAVKSRCCEATRVLPPWNWKRVDTRCCKTQRGKADEDFSSFSGIFKDYRTTTTGGYLTADFFNFADGKRSVKLKRLTCEWKKGKSECVFENQRQYNQVKSESVCKSVIVQKIQM